MGRGISLPPTRGHPSNFCKPPPKIHIQTLLFPCFSQTGQRDGLWPMCLKVTQSDVFHQLGVKCSGNILDIWPPKRCPKLCFHAGHVFVTLGCKVKVVLFMRGRRMGVQTPMQVYRVPYPQPLAHRSFPNCLVPSSLIL